MWTPDLEQARRATTPRQEDEEHVVFDVERYAALEWDEVRAPGRPETTGQWRLHYWDGTSAMIDLPLASMDKAVTAARDLIAHRLTGQ